VGSQGEVELLVALAEDFFAEGVDREEAVAAGVPVRGEAGIVMRFGSNACGDRSILYGRMAVEATCNINWDAYARVESRKRSAPRFSR